MSVPNHAGPLSSDISLGIKDAIFVSYVILAVDIGRRKELTFVVRFCFVAISLMAVVPSDAFGQNLFAKNLIVNGGADAGPAGTSLSSTVDSIPGWTVGAGKPNVLPYDLNGLLLSSQPSPPDRGLQYFVGPIDLALILNQDIDVSSGASAISSGNVKFTATAYLGTPSPTGGEARLDLAFKNASGQVLSTAVLGPLDSSRRDIGALYRQQRIGLVPPGTTRISLTLILSSGPFGPAAADSLAVQLDSLPTTSALGFNLINNPGADLGPAVAPPGVAPYIPGWSTALSAPLGYGASVAAYGTTGLIGATDPGPPDRGVNFFGGAYGFMYQDIDVSGSAAAIDSGSVSYSVSAWLGAANGGATPTLAYIFYDWTGNQLASTGQLGPVAHNNGTSLVQTSSSGTNIVPAGTRLVHIDLGFPSEMSAADNLSLILFPAGTPKITYNGIVPVYGTNPTIQPGSWISIYGQNFASSTSTWSGNFPTTLAGVTVTVNSKPAYLWYVSPTQINAQAPDDTAAGSVNVVVTNQNGSDTGTATLGQYGPSFSQFTGISGTGYIAAIAPVPVGTTGNSGAGFDYIGPSGGLPFTSRPAKAGETISLYGVGFGPTSPTVPAGVPLTGSAPALVMPQVTVGGVPAQVTFAGIIEAGLFQINVVVPSAGSGDKVIQATAGGLQTPAAVYLNLQ